MEAIRSFLAHAPHKGAFYTLSSSRFMSQYTLWMRHFPYVHPYYAVKCNPDPVLLRWLARRGVSFDCASAREMYMVQEHIGKYHMGNHVVFANPCKTPHDIDVGKTLGIPWVTADSVEECVKMDHAGYRPNVLLRLAVDDSGSSCPFGAKFGLEAEQVAQVARAAKSFNIPVKGLSFHVGSGSHDPKAYQRAIQQTANVWKSLQKDGLVGAMELLDIGGGWSADPAEFAAQAAAAQQGLKYGPTQQRTIAEPGRFFAAPTHHLYVRVVGKKPRKGGGWRYTLDESLYGQFSCIPFDHARPKFSRVVMDPDDFVRPMTPASLFGRTCDSLDWIANSKNMEELEVGDWLFVENMGAYTTATSTEFNGFPKPEVIQTDEELEASQLQPLTNLTYPFADRLRVDDAVAELR